MILPENVRDEILLATVLLPFVGVNLRAPLRPSMSISDASEQGGGAAEASAFVHEFAPEHTEGLHNYYSRLNEETIAFASRKPAVMCVICVLRFEPKYPFLCVCGPGCLARTCSASCFYKHKSQRCRVVPGAYL